MKQMVKTIYLLWGVITFLTPLMILNAQVSIEGDPTNYTTIQSALDAATSNDVISVDDGTYTENLSINTGITLKMATGATSVTIEGTVSINSDNVIIDGLTITNPSGKQGIYASDHSNIILRNLLVTDIGSTDVSTSGTNFGIAIVSSAAAVDNILIENNTITGITGGTAKSADGIAIGWSTGSEDITGLIIQNNNISNITSSTDPWISGGLGGKGANGIIINHGGGTTGKTVGAQILNNTINDLEALWAHGIGLEGNTLNAYVQGNIISNLVDHKSPSDPDAVAIMLEDNASANTVTIIGNSFINVWLGIRNATALPVNAAENWWDTLDPSTKIYEPGGGIVDYSPWWGDDYLSNTAHPWNWYTNDNIQDAINSSSPSDVIYVSAGLYEEAVVIDKSLTILGATHDTEKDDNYTVPSGYNWDTNTESVIVDPNSHLDGITVDITNTSDVVFKGFIVQSLTTATGNRHLLRINATSIDMDNINVSNNIIGPNTQVGDESNYGRMGLYLVPHYGNYAITNSLFSHNKIFDSGGNGNNVFVWGGYSTSANPIADLTDTVIEYNDIYGSRRSGIELAGGMKNLIIRNNKIHDNGFTGDDAPSSDYKYGNGICCIRIGSEKLITTAPDVQNLTIQGNEIYNNKKFGIYMGPMNTNHNITGNEIYNNLWDGIQIDLLETYHGGLNPIYDIATGISVNYNDIYDNGIGAEIVGVPTNSFTLDALDNWWGDVTGPYQATANTDGLGNEVSDYVDYNPWLGNTSDQPHDPDNNWTFYVDGSDAQAILDAIDSIIDGDTLVVDGGQIDALLIDKEIILIGMNGAEINNGSPAITVSADNVTIIGFTFDFGTSDYAIQVNDGYSNCQVHFCNFLTENAIDNQTTGSDVVNAEYNWWGDISGPTHLSNTGGTGSNISDNVDYSALISPSANATGISVEPAFSWSAVGGAISYSIQIAADEDFTNIVYNVTGLTSPSYNMALIVESLAYNSVYYWRVSAANSFSVNTTSVAATFSTVTEITPYLTAPVYGLEINSSVVNLYWNVYSSLPNLTYDVFYSTTQKSTYAGDEAASLKITGLTNTTASVTGLIPGTTYYWQVRVKSDGAIAGYSTVESFKIYGTLNPPVLYYPFDEMTSYTVSPYVYWLSYNYSMSIQYKVRYSTNGATDGVTGELTTDYDETDLTYDSYAQLLNLDEGETYYWQVSATNGVTTVWSDVFELLMPGAAPLVAPIPSYPTGGSVVYQSSPLLYWYSLNYATTLQYQVQYNEDGDETSGILNGSTQLPLTSNLSQQLSNLSGGQVYYWQVRAYNGSSYSDWSTIESFSVYQSIEVAQPPILLLPYADALVNTINPTLYWTVYGAQTGYTFTIVYNADGDQDGGGNLTDTRDVLGGASTVTTSGFYAQFVDDLSEGNTYYWQVIADKGGATEYSEVRAFTVNTNSSTGVHIPIPTAPVNDLVLNGDQATLYWLVYGSYSHLEFEVLYSINNSTTGGVLDTDVMTSDWTDQLYTTITNLTAGATYYWQVRSRLIATPTTMSDYSSVQTFSIYAGSSPSMSILGSPIGGVELSTDKPTLTWVIPTQSSSKLVYELEISENKDMTTAQEIKNISTNSCQVELPANKTYYWRVRSQSENGEYSIFTGNGEFKISKVITSVEENNDIPTEFCLSQNYPNPFNPSTNISFSITETANVNLKIYDLLGREVITLVDDNLSAGNYIQKWNGTDAFGHKVVSGTYIYRIIAGDKVSVKKMILLK